MISSIAASRICGQRHFRRMLGREHHGVDGMRLAVHVADRHLRFGIRAQPGQPPVAAQFRLAFHHAVREIDRQRHQCRRLVAGIAEHQALVARALVEVVIGCAVHALRDVRALLVVGHQHRAALVVDAVFGVVVADALDGVARHLDVVDVRGGGDLARQHHQAGIGQRLRCHPRIRVLR